MATKTRLLTIVRRFVLLTISLGINPQPSRAASDMAVCADGTVKTTVFSLAKLSAIEAACSRAMAGAATDAERQQAAFHRGLARFLQVVQKGAGNIQKRDGSVAYVPPTPKEVGPALVDIETAIALDGPLKATALTMRATINQVIGRPAEARADIDQAMQAAPKDPTPFVQRALEHENAGDIAAALADLDAALALDPAAGTALTARGALLQRLGELDRARADHAAAAALGPPFRSLALERKSEVELRMGDLRAAYDDLVAAAGEDPRMPDVDARAAKAELLVRAGDLALDKLKEPDAAEGHYLEADRLVRANWSAALGLARIAERRGDRGKAATIYRRILTGTKSTPQLLERILASLRLKQLTEPVRRASLGPFVDVAEAGGPAAKGSPDGLKRVAFVIGEGDYAELASLPNARRDAAVMANALAEMGFDVVEIAENLGKAELRGVPALIAGRAAQADVVLVFYAGHGVEADGANYLIPVDAAPESDRELAADALALADLTAAAAKARRGSLVIVDACRDDPFVEARAAARSRGADRALSREEPPRLKAGLAAAPAPAANAVVFHSTQPGQTALDGDGLDSPFVRALLETLGSPGKRFDAVLRDTTARVSEKTGKRQLPAAYGVAPAVALLPPAPRR